VRREKAMLTHIGFLGVVGGGGSVGGVAEICWEIVGMMPTRFERAWRILFKIFSRFFGGEIADGDGDGVEDVAV